MVVRVGARALGAGGGCRREGLQGELDGDVRGAARAIGVGVDPGPAGASPDGGGGERRRRLPELRDGPEHGDAPMG